MLNFFRPATQRLTQAAAQHINHRFRKWHAAGFEIQHVGGLDAARDEKHRHVADNFAARRDLHDVTEQLVHLGVSARDLRPAMTEAHRARLFFEIRELSAGHLVQINFRAAGFWRRVKRRVVIANLFPVIRKFIQRLQVQTRVALGELQRSDNGIQIRLARRTAHRSDGKVNYIYARIGGGQNGCGRNAARVVRMKMDWNSNFTFQRLHQCAGGGGFAEAGHVLDGDHVRAHFL